MLKMIKKNSKGFTLIELIVVIAILGILALIAIPRLSGFSDSANLRAIETNHRTLISTINVLYTEENEWPADLSKTSIEDLLGKGFSVTGNKISDDSGAIHTWAQVGQTDEYTLTTTLTKTNKAFTDKYGTDPLQYSTND
jgi:type IV pilus assembly protein PilA